jgi:hypothetical protein
MTTAPTFDSIIIAQSELGSAIMGVANSRFNETTISIEMNQPQITEGVQ